MSRKPFTPSRLLLPTEMKVLGTPVATPTVYWISRFCNEMSDFRHQTTYIIHTASIPAWLLAWLFCPPSSVCKLKVVVEGMSGRRRAKNVCHKLQSVHRCVNTRCR